nr:NFACT family protein [Anaerolineae bacterium]
MYVDSVTIAALAAEFQSKLVGGRVQALYEIDSYAVGFEIYAHRRRHYLYMTADPTAARCHLVPDRLRRGAVVSSPLGLLLKKYVDGAGLVNITQPRWERVLHVDFSGHEGTTRLIVELMDKRSNLILTVGNDILDSIKRVDASQNRYRQILPGRPYIPPPPQDKLSPDNLTLSSIDRILKQEPEAQVAQLLVQQIAGISPLFAREIIFFASGDPTAQAYDVSAGMVYAALTQRIQDVVKGNFQPCIVPVEDGETFRAFAAYPLTHLGRWQSVESISEAMAIYFGAPAGQEAYAPAKDHVRHELDGALEQAQRKLAALERELKEPAEIDTLRKQGELILAYGATLRPGQSALRAKYAPDEPELVIPLDPSLSYPENAREYFDKYEKAKRAAADVPALKKQAAQELAYLEQLSTDLSLAESWPEIDAVREALQDAGFWKGPRRKGPSGGKPGLRRFEIGDDFVILVGRNAEQNHQLLTQKSGGDDLWLHARGVPGSHVIIKSDGRKIPEEVIRRAAQLAAYYSASRDDTQVQVDVTERRFVRPIKGGGPGMVTYRNERTLPVKPSAK